MKYTTVCYIEKDDSYLMLHRIKKENDANRDKWIGIGGKFLDGESPRTAFSERFMRKPASL
jgi:8-oxo-dGTP diphosphatase